MATRSIRHAFFQHDSSLLSFFGSVPTTGVMHVTIYGLPKRDPVIRRVFAPCSVAPADKLRSSVRGQALALTRQMFGHPLSSGTTCPVYD